MDFGTYLKHVLDKKNIHLSKLASDIGLKSKNTIYRLFDNYYSYDKAIEITDRIISAVEFDEEEKQRIYELIKTCRIKKNVLSACKLLQKLYLPPEAPDFDIFKGGKSLWLRSDCEAINMFLSHCQNDKSAQAAQIIFDHASDAEKTLKHFVDFSAGELHTAGALYSIIKLSSYSGYSCIETNGLDFLDLMGLIKLKNSYGMFFVNEKGQYVETELSEEMYKFIFDKYVHISGKELKFIKGKVTDYAQIISDFSIVETNDSFSFEGVLCFGEIPFETMHTLLKDSGYFGFPPDSPFIQKLIQAAKNRYELHLNSDARRTYILNPERVEHFFNTGRTIDHVDLFRNLTKQERIYMLEHFLSDSDRFRYRFFKPEFKNYCIECGIVDNERIFIWEGVSGYGKNHFHMIIDNPKALKLYKSFTEYFWDFCTFSDEESHKILMDIVNKADLYSD